MKTRHILLLTLACLSMAACDRRDEQPVEPSETATTVAPPAPDAQSTGSDTPTSSGGNVTPAPPEDADADTNSNNIPPAAREEEASGDPANR